MKKKYSKSKMMGFIISICLIVIGTVVGITLVSQNTDLRKSAYGGERISSGQKIPFGGNRTTDTTVNFRTTKHFSQWLAYESSPWVFRKKFGGMGFLDYRPNVDRTLLQQEVRTFLTKYPSDKVLVMVNFADVRIPKFNHDCDANPENTCLLKLPEGNTTISEFVEDYNFLYFKDLVGFIKAEGAQPYIYPVLSPYGGQVIYPFTYYSKLGWFWKRPDWQNGLADPRIEAMRHPTAAQNTSTYNWFEHEAGYANINNAYRHGSQTLNNTEDTALGIWNVFEEPDMVFNGYDTVLHGNTLNIHTPVPSMSSPAYLSLLNEFYSQVAMNFSSTSAAGYVLFQEPSYAHLRENMKYCAFNAVGYGEIGGAQAAQAQNTCIYEVDYSAAELTQYNTWLQGIKKPVVSSIPYPADTLYKRFKSDNLAKVMRNLSTSLRKYHSNAKIMASIFYALPTDQSSLEKVKITEDSIFGEWIDGTGNSISKILNATDPDLLMIEPGENLNASIDNGGKLNYLFESIQQWKNTRGSKVRLTEVLLLHQARPGLSDIRALQDAARTAGMFINLPTFSSNGNLGSYAIWVGHNDCADCKKFN